MTTQLRASQLADIGCGVRGLANGMNIPYVRALFFESSDPGVQRCGSHSEH
jgi:hypothetical protein